MSRPKHLTGVDPDRAVSETIAAARTFRVLHQLEDLCRSVGLIGPESNDDILVLLRTIESAGGTLSTGRLCTIERLSLAQAERSMLRLQRAGLVVCVGDLASTPSVIRISDVGREFVARVARICFDWSGRS